MGTFARTIQFHFSKNFLMVVWFSPFVKICHGTSNSTLPRFADMKRLAYLLYGSVASLFLPSINIEEPPYDTSHRFASLMNLRHQRYLLGYSKQNFQKYIYKDQPKNARKKQYYSSCSRLKQPTLGHLLYQFFRLWKYLLPVTLLRNVANSIKHCKDMSLSMIYNETGFF